MPAVNGRGEQHLARLVDEHVECRRAVGAFQLRLDRSPEDFLLELLARRRVLRLIRRLQLRARRRRFQQRPHDRGDLAVAIFKLRNVTVDGDRDALVGTAGLVARDVQRDDPGERRRRADRDQQHQQEIFVPRRMVFVRVCARGAYETTLESFLRDGVDADRGPLRAIPGRGKASSASTSRAGADATHRLVRAGRNVVEDHVLPRARARDPRARGGVNQLDRRLGGVGEQLDQPLRTNRVLGARARRELWEIEVVAIGNAVEHDRFRRAVVKHDLLPDRSGVHRCRRVARIDVQIQRVGAFAFFIAAEGSSQTMMSPSVA